MTIKLLVIDSTVIANSTPPQLKELEDVCANLAQEGVQFALVSTNNQGMRSATNKGAQISFSASLSGEEVLGTPSNKFKGGAVRIESVCNALGIAGNDKADTGRVVAPVLAALRRLRVHARNLGAQRGRVGA